MKKRTLCFLLLAASSLLPTRLFSQAPIRVPKTSQAVMVDGKISPGEWDHAAKLPLGDFARVYVQQSTDHIWIALELLKSDTGTLDLYLASGDKPLTNFHSSAKLGQRVLQQGSWPQEWKWWNNDRWVANVSRLDTFDKHTFMPETVREFQISRSWFPGNDFRLMFEIMTPAQQSWETTPFPPNARNTDSKNWFAFRLD